MCSMFISFPFCHVDHVELFNSKELTLMWHAAWSRHTKAQPESISKQTGRCMFSDLLEEPSLLVLLLLLLIFHYFLSLPSSPSVLWCEDGTHPLFCLCVCECVSVCCCHCYHACMSANMTSVCMCKDVTWHVLNDNLSEISKFSP